MCPVFPEGGQDVTQRVWPEDKQKASEFERQKSRSSTLRERNMNRGSALTPGDGSIYVRDDDLVIPVPEVDGSLTAAGSLILSGHAEHHVIGAVLQLKGQLWGRESERRENALKNNSQGEKYWVPNLWLNLCPHQLLWGQAECFLVRDASWWESRFRLEDQRALLGCKVVFVTGRWLIFMSGIRHVNEMYLININESIKMLKKEHFLPDFHESILFIRTTSSIFGYRILE